MYFKLEDQTPITVEKPFRRVITPIMMADNSTSPMGFSIHLTEWEPGAQVDLHEHPDLSEAMYCISGHGVASVNGEEFDFVPHSMIAAGPGEPHHIKNTGDELLRVVCVFSPPVTGEDLRKRAQDAVDQWQADHP